MLQQFDAHLNALLCLPDNAFNAGQPPRLIVALSGGSDSMALLHLARRTPQKQPLIALTVDHALRAESAQEAAQVGRWMHDQGIEHHILRRSASQPRGNLQAYARQLRYDLLAQYCHQRAENCAVLLGHTLDDQAETIALMQARGAGPIGLAGMSARVEKQGVCFLRPLLAQPRQALRDWLIAQDIAWLDDPSNENTQFDRIRWRQAFAANPQRKAELLALGQAMAQQRQHYEARYARFVADHVFEDILDKM